MQRGHLTRDPGELQEPQREILCAAGIKGVP